MSSVRVPDIGKVNGRNKVESLVLPVGMSNSTYFTGYWEMSAPEVFLDQKPLFEKKMTRLCRHRFYRIKRRPKNAYVTQTVFNLLGPLDHTHQTARKALEYLITIISDQLVQ